MDALSATVAQAFPAVFITDLPDSYNTILFAAGIRRHRGRPLTESEASDAPAESTPLGQIMAITQGGRAETRFADMIFTDDKAPIEFMTNRLVITFLLGGDKE